MCTRGTYVRNTYAKDTYFKSTFTRDACIEGIYICGFSTVKHLDIHLQLS